MGFVFLPFNILNGLLHSVPGIVIIAELIHRLPAL